MVICDIDDTLLSAGTHPIQKNIDYLNSLPGRKVIVTGRPKSDRAATVKALHAAGVKYGSLLMNPYSAANSNKFKEEVGHKLHDATLAIDNNPDARRAYAKAGIKTLDPAAIPNIKKFWDIPQYNYPMENPSEDYLVGLEDQRIIFFSKLRDLILEKDKQNDNVATAVLGWAYERLAED